MKTLSIALLILIIMSGQLNADNHSATKNKITLNLDDTSEVTVKGFIASVEESLSDTFKEWDELANLRVADPEKHYPASVFQAFLPKTSISVGEFWVLDMTGIVTLLKQLHPNPNFFLHINAGGFTRFMGMSARLQRSIRRHRVSDSRRIQTQRRVVYTIPVYRTSCD